MVRKQGGKFNYPEATVPNDDNINGTGKKMWLGDGSKFMETDPCRVAFLSDCGLWANNRRNDPKSTAGKSSGSRQ